MKRRAHAALDFALVGGVALFVRLLHARGVARTPFFEGPVIDGFTYRAFAEHIARTGDYGGAFYQPPLYPAFLALLFRLGLTSAWQVAFVQSTLGACTAILMTWIARRLCSHALHARSVGLLCGLATALYGPLVLFDVELLPPCCVDLLLATGLALSLRVGSVGLVDAVLGLTLGLGVVAWPPFGVLAVGFLAVRARQWPGQRAALLVVSLSCAVVPLAFTARHNAQHGAPGVAVSYNLGINLWLGNNPNWRDTWRARPGALFEPELERPDREGVTEPEARSAFFTRLVLRDAAKRPWAALTRTAEKAYYAWYGRELRRDQDVESLREASPVLRGLLWENGLLFPFGALAPLGLLGLWRRRREPQVRVVAAMLGAYTVVLAVFFVSSRYRLPLALLLLPFAADHALYLARFWRQVQRVGWALAGLLLLLNFPNAFSKTFAASPAERGILRAQALRNRGSDTEADALSETLVVRFPDDPNVRMLRAEQLIQTHQYAAAEPHLRRAIELGPRTAAPRLLLADCLEQLNEPAKAERELANALALHPYHPVALKKAGIHYLRERRSREAHALLSRFVAAGYRDPDVTAWLQQLDSPDSRAN